MATYPVGAASVSIRTTRQHRDFEALKKRIRSNANRAAYNFARGAVQEIRMRAPKRTGFMASQVKWTRVSAGVFDVYVDGNITAKTGAFYSVYVEYGTRNMAAQPFFRPAIEARKRIFIDEMKAVFR